MSDQTATEILSAHGVRPSALASSLRINKSTISRWKRIPAERVLEVERATGVSRHDLRPDLYPVDSAPLPLPPTPEPAQ